MRHLLAVIMAVLLSYPWPAAAEQSGSVTQDRQVETRLKQLSLELRCLVCQNQTLADSHAPLAEDLRSEIRTMIVDGRSDEEIMDFLVSRYGDFVRYRPPLKATTWLLWFGPFLFLASGAAALGITLRRRQRQPADAPLSETERSRADRLLSEEKNTP